MEFVFVFVSYLSVVYISLITTNAHHQNIFSKILHQILQSLRIFFYFREPQTLHICINQQWKDTYNYSIAQLIPIQSRYAEIWNCWMRYCWHVFTLQSNWNTHWYTDSVWNESFKRTKPKMLGELLLTIGIGLIGYAFYKLSTNSAKYFKDRNLKYSGVLTSLSNQMSAVLGRHNILTMVKNMYDAFPDVP